MCLQRRGFSFSVLRSEPVITGGEMVAVGEIPVVWDGTYGGVYKGSKIFQLSTKEVLFI